MRSRSGWPAQARETGGLGSGPADEAWNRHRIRRWSFRRSSSRFARGPTATAQRGPRSDRDPPASVGGLGFALVGEYWSEPVDFGLGPRVEVGVGSGALALVLCETLRFGMGSDVDTLTFDTQGGLAWGAPFQPAHRFGLLLLGGLEWFTEFGGDGRCRPSRRRP